jgi:hypothetical protein
MIVNIIGDVYRSIFIFTLFCVVLFLGIFLPFLDTSGIFGASVEISGILEVLVSYEVTRWIILVVARVHDGFGGVGGFKGFFGEVLGGPMGVCYTPIRHFLLI